MCDVRERESRSVCAGYQRRSEERGIDVSQFIGQFSVSPVPVLTTERLRLLGPDSGQNRRKGAPNDSLFIEFLDPQM